MVVERPAQWNLGFANLKILPFLERIDFKQTRASKKNKLAWYLWVSG